MRFRIFRVYVDYYLAIECHVETHMHMYSHTNRFQAQYYMCNLNKCPAHKFMNFMVSSHVCVSNGGTLTMSHRVCANFDKKLRTHGFHIVVIECV